MEDEVESAAAWVASREEDNEEDVVADLVARDAAIDSRAYARGWADAVKWAVYLQTKALSFGADYLVCELRKKMREVLKEKAKESCNAS